MGEALEALAARCEQAMGPSDELQFAIGKAVGAMEETAPFQADGSGAKYCPAYTHSVDAALTLVPEGESAGYRVAYHPELRRKAFAEIWTHEDAEPGDGFFRAAAQTPALAITAAALRARAA